MSRSPFISALILFLLFSTGVAGNAQGLVQYHPEDATFIGVWRSGKGSTTQMISPPSIRFSSAKNGAATKGYPSPSEVEISDRDVYYTVWEKNTNTGRGSFRRDPNRIVEGSWSTMLNLLKTRPGTRSYTYLKNIEVLYNNGKTTYQAIVAQGGHPKQELHRAANWDRFVSLWKTLSARKMRLTSVEFDRGQFIGLFEAGTQGYYLYNFTGWSPFAKKWEELGKKNYRLVDLEVYRSNTGKWHYVGVWLPGSDGYYLWNLKGYDNFAKKFNELKGKYELVDLEIIP